MITSLYGLWVEDTETKGHNPIGYFDTWEELEEEVNNITEKVKQLPKGKRLFKVEHEYNKKTNVITEFNYDKRIYI